MKKNINETIVRIKEMMGLEKKLYIDWDTNYGKTFKIVYTPKGSQSGKWEKGLISIVTPENGESWFKWKELSNKRLEFFKKQWDVIQKSLGDHKYEQIIRSQNKIKKDSK